VARASAANNGAGGEPRAKLTKYTVGEVLVVGASPGVGRGRDGRGGIAAQVAAGTRLRVGLRVDVGTEIGGERRGPGWSAASRSAYRLVRGVAEQADQGGAHQFGVRVGSM